MMIPIPNKWLEEIFGTFVAQNFNKITFALLIGGYIISKIVRNRRDNNWLKRAQKKSQTRFEYMNRNVIEASQARKAKETRDKDQTRQKTTKKFIPPNDGKIYSATGWVWNENTKLWEPPADFNKKK